MLVKRDHYAISICRNVFTSRPILFPVTISFPATAVTWLKGHAMGKLLNNIFKHPLFILANLLTASLMVVCSVLVLLGIASVLWLFGFSQDNYKIIINQQHYRTNVLIKHFIYLWLYSVDLEPETRCNPKITRYVCSFPPTFLWIPVTPCHIRWPGDRFNIGTSYWSIGSLNLGSYGFLISAINLFFHIGSGFRWIHWKWPSRYR